MSQVAQRLPQPIKPRDDSASIMETVMAKGDLSQLTPAERNSYYLAVCHSVRLNPLTRPLEYITLSGRMVLYARRDATDQLRTIHRVSIEEMTETEMEGVYIVTVKARNGEGRTDMAKGAVNINGLKGEALANAMMKGETKAKRRVTLSLCGLGLLDETEALDVAASENAAGSGEKISEAQATELIDLCEAVGADRVKYLKYLKVESLNDLPKAKFADAKGALEAKRSKA